MSPEQKTVRKRRAVLYAGYNMNTEDFVKIAVLENIIEAQLIDSMMNEQHIPHRIRSFYDTAYDGLFQFQKGWGDVFAPSVFREDILEILRNIRSSQ